MFGLRVRSGDQERPGACPFNYLYWAFLIGSADRLSDNHRLGTTFATLKRWDAARRASIVAEAWAFLDGLPVGYG